MSNTSIVFQKVLHQIAKDYRDTGSITEGANRAFDAVPIELYLKALKEYRSIES